MVLSLGFILSLIGASVGLLVGILIFGEVSDSISCPASGGGGGSPSVFNVTSYDNLGTLGSGENAVYAEAEVIVDFLPPVTGRINEAVIQEGTSSLDLNGEIYLGTTPSNWWFLSGGTTGSNLVSISFWINGDVVGSAEYPLLSNFAPNTQTDGIFIITESGALRPQIENDNFDNIEASYFSNTQPPDDSNWHLLTITYDKSITAGNANMIYCLDGTVNNVTTGTSEGCHSGATAQNGATVVSWTVSNNAPIDKLTIGSDNNHFFTGMGNVVENTFMIDDLAIWNGYLLTNTDIDNLWNSGSGASVSSLAISPSTLKGYWSFDNSTANGVITGGGGGGSGETGSEQCQQAKDTAWTVIGIMPVALFFALFSIFGALGKTGN